MRRAPTHQAHGSSPSSQNHPEHVRQPLRSEMRAREQADGGLAQGHRWVGGRDTHFTATPPALRSTEHQEEKKGRLPSINTGLFTSSGPSACNSNSVSNKSEYLLTLRWLRNVGWKVHRPSNKRAWEVNRKDETRTRQPADAEAARTFSGH